MLMLDLAWKQLPLLMQPTRPGEGGEVGDDNLPHCANFLSPAAVVVVVLAVGAESCHEQRKQLAVIC